MTRKKKIEIWFQDEARIGQKNGLVRQWARRGTRPIQPADQRYESAYLFGAICPARGVGAALALPFADTDEMQRHINEIALHVARGAHAVLVLDRAGWHTTGNLVWPKNDRGYTGDNSSSYLRTGFTPSTAGGKYAQNNAHPSAGLLNNVIGNKISIVSASGSPPFGLLRPRFTGDTFNVALNTGGGLTTANSRAPSSVGLAAVSRLDGSNVSIFRGSTDFGAAQSTTAIVIVSAEIQLLGGGGVFSDGQIYAASIGEGLTLAQFMAMDPAINVYKTSIGAP